MKFNNEIRSNTKKQKNLVWAHDNARHETIYDCYVRPSDAKICAWKACEYKRRELKGFDLVVNSYNTRTFTASFLFEDCDTGVLRLYTMTKEHDYVCDYI